MLDPRVLLNDNVVGYTNLQFFNALYADINNLLPVDLVSDYTNQQFFNALSSDISSLPVYRERLIIPFIHNK